MQNQLVYNFRQDFSCKLFFSKKKKKKEKWENLQITSFPY